MRVVTMGTGMVCNGSVTSACDQRDVLPVIVGFEPTPRPMCAACRSVAESIGLAIREWKLRQPERRRSRFALPGDTFGRRASDRAEGVA